MGAADFCVSAVMATPPVDRHINAVERRHPAVVVETHIAAGCFPVGAVATHPVPRAVRQRLAVRLVVPAAKRHVAATVPLLALFAWVVTVTGVRHPQRVSGPHAVRVDDELEVVAAALERGEALRGQQQEDLDQQVMRQHGEIRLRLEQLLQPLTHLQEVLRHRRTPAHRHDRKLLLLSSVSPPPPLLLL